MAPDYPGAPAWFEEGIASLYEQCRVERERLVGLLNWRLPILQKAIPDETGYVPLNRLVRMDDAVFYGTGSPIHYAEARYLMLYIQRAGVLESFYRAMRDARPPDRDPAAILCELLKKDDIDAVDEEFRAWAVLLRR
jgi:hypothetical protein